jgi:hypothetical protein
MATPFAAEMSNEPILTLSAPLWLLDFKACFDRPESAIQNEVTHDWRKKDTSATHGTSGLI